MKKALSLILALVLCLSLCACGGGETPNTTDNNETQQETENRPTNDNSFNEDNTQNTTDTNSDNAQDQEKINLICGIWWYQLSPSGIDFGRKFYDDGRCEPAAGGNLTGTWTLDGDVISLTSAKPNSNQVFEYQLKTYGDVHFLIGKQETWVSVKENEIPSKVQTKEVSISLDNWQDYFEYITFSQTSKKIDLFGTATEETKTFGILKLKDEYSRHVIQIVSTVDAKFTIAGEEYTSGLRADRVYSIIDYPEPGGTYGQFDGQELYYFGAQTELGEDQVNGASFEMMNIQGTLYFIDIE